MESEFLEKYDKLKSMQPGDVAVSKDRKNFFVCGHYYNGNVNIKIILDLNNLWDQYTDQWNMEQPIRKLISGDKFVITK